VLLYGKQVYYCEKDVTGFAIFTNYVAYLSPLLFLVSQILSYNLINQLSQWGRLENLYAVCTVNANLYIKC
jgi:hypothetical protein